MAYENILGMLHVMNAIEAAKSADIDEWIEAIEPGENLSVDLDAFMRNDEDGFQEPTNLEGEQQ